MTRQQANYQLTNLLHEIVKKYPDLRFSQILQNFDYIKVQEIKGMNAGGTYHYLVWKDEFYLEPQDLLKRVEESLNERSND